MRNFMSSNAFRPLALALLAAMLAIGIAAAGMQRGADSQAPANTVLGVTVLDGAADDGYVLLTPFNNREVGPDGHGISYLIDKRGEVIHQWLLPEPLGGYAALYPNGDLVYIGKSDDVREKKYRMPAGGEAGGLYRLNWEGDLVWSYEDPYIHHDFELLPDGSYLTLRWVPLPTEVSDRISGGMPGTEHEDAIWGDDVIRISPDGEVEVVWSSARHLDPERYPVPEFMKRAEWTHANSIRYLESNPIDGQEAILLSFRHISLVLIAALDDGEVIWSYGGPGVLNQQHDPTLTADGTVLLFDNGQYRYGSLPSSWVIEIDPLTDETVWVYRGEGVAGWRFFSSVVSGAQRLPNGNTLITEGFPGRMLEVDTDGEIVWEYFHPYGGPDVTGARAPDNAIFKARSYPRELVDPLLSD